MAPMTEPSKWARIIAADPDHSQRYIERFKMMEAAGHDLAGEVRTVDAMVSRGARILDAGCGPGRVGGRLHALGHDVVGVDVDPALIEAAGIDHPGPVWVVGDLAELDLPAQGVAADFDVIVSAGNVMGFLAPSTRVEVLRRFARHLAADGRAIIGFGAGRGYEFADFFADLDAAGLSLDVALSTWDLRPFTATSDFLVAICSRSS
ncbi:Magnesium-protoporphyrin O-methyltransferase [Tessaracoccus lapidicaptus]|nr:Magnesium-protoporphyrin O-methyltransferase [Tessaracoccus lapidicaptus]